MLGVAPSDEEATFTRPDGFDSLDAVRRALTATPREDAVVVTLATTLDEARRHIPPSLAALEEIADGVALRCSTDSPEWLARIIAGLGCDLVVHEPPELRAALRRLADRLRTMADPETFYMTPHYAGSQMLLVRLVTVDPEDLRDLLVQAWRSQAPKRLTALF